MCVFYLLAPIKIKESKYDEEPDLKLEYQFSEPIA